MNSKELRYEENFIHNGDFLTGLQGWTPVGGVVRSVDDWNGTPTANMHAYNEGAASQTIDLAAYPRPHDEKAVYELEFYYEAYGRGGATLRIETAHQEQNWPLVPSLKTESERPVDPNKPRAISLVRYTRCLDLIDASDDNVTVTFISKADVGANEHGVRVAFVRVELLLEDLRLKSLTIDDEPQSLEEPLRLCFGALGDKSHRLLLAPADDSVWRQTQAGLWLEEDTTALLSASPPWEHEQLIEDAWAISCRVPADDEQEYPHPVQVRSQYTAAPYDLTARSGHFRLELAVVQDVAYYPVVALKQSVTMRVKVQSHYTETALPNREVTWAVTSKNASAAPVLFTQRSDENGESTYTYTPTVADIYQVTASVDSHYRKDDAKHVFQVRALAADPWATAKFSLENTTTPFLWGAQPAYPCRGGSHRASVTFPAGHALAGTDLMLRWETIDGDTPGGLGVTFSPELDDMTAIDAAGLTWSMNYEDNKDANFNLVIRCSKLLEDSPAQRMELAHNWLDIVADRQAPKFPFVDEGVRLHLEVQVSSQVESVQVGRGIDVEWRLDDGAPDSTGTGDGGWSGHLFDLDEARTLKIVASVESRYEGKRVEKEFDVMVDAGHPWQSLVNITLDENPVPSRRLAFFLDGGTSVLRVDPADDRFLNEKVSLEVGDGESPIEATPNFGAEQEMTVAGVTWDISPIATTSTRFPLYIGNETLGPLEFDGLLLSTTLEEEGELTFDGRKILAADKIYPSIGGTHTLRFVPKASSPLILLDVAAQWAPDALGIGLDPPASEPNELPSSGFEWKLTAPQTGTAEETGLSLSFPQIDLTYPPVSLNLGHHRFEISGTGPDADLWVGESVLLEIEVLSHYTKAPLNNVDVTFRQASGSETRPTGSDGKAKFWFEGKTSGRALVLAEVPSAYYDPADYPSHEFVIQVYGR
ncbi:Ig-like domain-containing protein [Pseudomonas sp. SWRI154]|uniref:Ig-like domain-containing protein n=1 Tax=Pseudomonas sp. SWRI154 TaxID=2745501 RepID=UPI001647A7E4|nr:Ig-like domain-containing protein [Pseudomonas sp. SWRI154]MBC3363964.1 hypothetical protein [Pseudomonas sp. SWRI154]